MLWLPHGLKEVEELLKAGLMRNCTYSLLDDSLCMKFAGRLFIFIITFHVFWTSFNHYAYDSLDCYIPVKGLRLATSKLLGISHSRSYLNVASLIPTY